MGRKMLLWVLGYSWLALLVGLILLGTTAYTIFNASRGGGMPQAGDLSAAKGSVLAGREVTVERKRRRGGKTTTHFFELDLKPETAGDVVKLRVDFSVDRAKLEATMGQQISAAFDPGDHNMVYEITGEKGSILSKAEMAKILADRAATEKANMTSGSMMGISVILALLGAGGLVWRRKLVAQETA